MKGLDVHEELDGSKSVAADRAAVKEFLEVAQKLAGEGFGPRALTVIMLTALSVITDVSMSEMTQEMKTAWIAKMFYQLSDTSQETIQ